MKQIITDIDEAIRIECEALGDADYTIPQIVDIIDRDYPEAVAEATNKGRRRTITNHVKSHVAPPKQPRLPGFEGLPLRISLRAEGGGFVYRSSLVASIDDFRAHLEILNEGIKADTVARDQFRDAIENAERLLRTHNVERLADVPVMQSASKDAA
jgi:hypothetical protein